MFRKLALALVCLVASSHAIAADYTPIKKMNTHSKRHYSACTGGGQCNNMVETDNYCVGRNLVCYYDVFCSNDGSKLCGTHYNPTCGPCCDGDNC